MKLALKLNGPESSAWWLTPMTPAPPMVVALYNIRVSYCYERASLECMRPIYSIVSEEDVASDQGRLYTGIMIMIYHAPPNASPETDEPNIDILTSRTMASHWSIRR